jgi:hypothetical protein
VKRGPENILERIDIMKRKNTSKPVPSHLPLFRIPQEDKLVNRKVEADEDKLLYLHNHYKYTRRTPLAKKLGISKIDLLILMRQEGLGDNGKGGIA